MDLSLPLPSLPPYLRLSLDACLQQWCADELVDGARCDRYHGSVLVHESAIPKQYYWIVHPPQFLLPIYHNPSVRCSAEEQLSQLRQKIETIKVG